MKNKSKFMSRNFFQFFSLVIKGLFSPLLRGVPTRNALFEKQNICFTDNTFKASCRLVGWSIPSGCVF